MSVAENVFQEFIGHMIYILLYYFEFNLEKKVILKQKLKTNIDESLDQSWVFL